MRERINDKGRLQHILSSINIILDNKDRFKLEEIESDPIVFFGFVKQLEIIGEAVYMLSKEFRNQHNDVEWDAIEGMRHVLVHGYYQIRPSQLWNTIQQDIPTLKPQIESLLASEEDARKK